MRPTPLALARAPLAFLEYLKAARPRVHGALFLPSLAGGPGAPLA